MTTHALYEVVPAAKGWIVRMPADSVSELHADKGAAIRRARELGRRCDEWRIRVLTADGSVEKEMASSGPSP